MTRTFDSGLAKPLPTLVRDDVKTLLAPLLRSAGGFAMGIVDFPFPIKSYVNDDYELSMLFEQLDGRSPAYAVCIGDIKGMRKGGADSWWGDADVDVYACSTHPRNMVLGRLGVDQQSLADDTLDPGIEVMRELARMLLTSATLPSLGRQATDLKWQGDHHMITTREFTVWAIRFEVGLTVKINLTRNVTELLAEIRTSHRIGAGQAPDPATQPIIVESTIIPPP